jgi:hypothetical protein
MEAINEISSFVEAMSQIVARQVLLIDPTLLATAILSSVFISSMLLIVSPRLVVILGATGLILLGIFVVVAPDSAIIVLTIGCGLLGVIRFRRRVTIMELQLDELTRAVRGLETAENRRFMRSLKSTESSSSFMPDAPSIVSSEQMGLETKSTEFHVLRSSPRRT